MLLLAKQEGRAASALQFAILTAARSGEVRGACWSELNLAEGVWTIPGERMKAGKEHRVPLAPSVRTLVRNMPRSSDLVFPGRQSSTQLSDMSLTAVLRRLGHGDITVHGFRSTFREWFAEAISNTFSREVCEHALAHSLPDRVTLVGRRAMTLEENDTSGYKSPDQNYERLSHKALLPI